MSDAPLAFIGLGNPGAKHAGNRHNIGFMAAASLAREARASFPQQKFSGMLQQADYGGRRLYFFLPQTFMNRSGVPSSELIRFYKIPIENVIVLHDELDLALAKIRIKQGGGAAGHNGLKSLDQHIGNNYWRLRLGIDHPGIKEMVHSHVLSDFSASEQRIVDDLIANLAKQLPKLVDKDMAKVVSDIALTQQTVQSNKE